MAVRDDLFEIASKHLDCVVDLRAGVLVDRLDGSSGGLLQFVEQLDRKRGEIVDEVEGVFNLVRNASRELPERGHLLSLYQACLRKLEVFVGCLSGIASSPDLRLRAFAVGNVAVN